MGISVFRATLTQELQGLRSSATFLTIRGYKNTFNEVADHSICFHIDYMKAVLRSLNIVKDFKPEASHCLNKSFSLKDLKLAREELLESYVESLAGHNSRYTQHQTYDQLKASDGSILPGIKLHREEDVLHLEGYRIHKLVHAPGVYPQVNSFSKTVAKNFLRELTPLSRWGQYKLMPGRFNRLVVEKLTIGEYDVIRQHYPEDVDG